MVKEITVIELKNWMDKKYPHILIDVRPKDERNKAKLDFAIPLYQITQPEISSLDKNLNIVFHCHHGGRSLKEAKKWEQNGFKNVFSLSGGINSWALYIDAKVPTYE